MPDPEFTNETLTQDRFAERCNQRIAFLEEQRMEALLNEASPRSAQAPGGPGALASPMGVPPIPIDPATGGPAAVTAPAAEGDEQETIVQAMTREIDDLVRLRDSYKVDGAAASKAKSK